MAVIALPGSASAASTSAGHLRVAIDSASHAADFSRTAARSNVVILQEWEKARLRSLKVSNPGLKVLMYKNLSAVSPTEWGNAGTGVTKEQAEVHPEWFLKNTSGARFTFNNYGFLWAADIGNPAYQAKWADNVLAKLKADAWDGVFVDDSNPTMRYHYNVTSVAKYPSDATYSAATGSALAYIGPRIRAQGELVIPNFGDWRRYRSTVGEWLKSVSGGMEEQFTKHGESSGSGYFTGADWDDQLAVVKQTQAMGKLFLGVTHSDGGDHAAARYGWATALLAAEGSASFALHTDYTNETWFAEYDYDLGAPTGVETKVAGGVHRRAFRRGLVLVNPTSASVSVEFGGRYHGSGLASTARSVMAPHTGLVLLAAATPGSAPPTFHAVVAPLPPAASTARADTPPAATAPPVKAAVTIPRNARRSLRVRVVCRSKARPCRRLVTVVLRHKGKRAQVGRRRVTLRRTARISVRLDARGRAALAQGRRLRAVVRARS